jgi:3-oxoacyl-[acyl-carrier protein] reductase
MARELEARTAIVTGAARGIGRGIAARLAAEGCRVAAWDRDPSPRSAPGFAPAHAETMDVADPDAVARALDATLAALGRVDILVNNAGVNGPTVPIWEYPLEAWHKVLAVDLTGVFLCCKAVIPHLRARGSGRIVNVASIAGKEGNPNSSAYCAAKAGVIGLTKALAKELFDTQVTVNCVTPAMVETDLMREMSADYIAFMKAKIPLGRFCTVEEIADMVAWIASPRCSFSTGAVFDLSGGRATY